METRTRLWRKREVGASPEGVVVDGGSVWTANHHGGSVTRVSAKTDQVEATVRTGYRANSGPQGIASGLGSIWVGVSNVNSVFRIDPATNERQAKIPLSTEALACGDFALTDDAVWITSCGELPSATALDPTTNEVIQDRRTRRIWRRCNSRGRTGLDGANPA